jgi:isocitrate dehydrogenase
MMSSTHKTKTIGADVFLVQKEIPKAPEALGGLTLKSISNRGTKVWPGKAPKIQMTDHYCCRYLSDKPISAESVVELLRELEKRGFYWVQVEKLLQIDGKNAFSDAQGE